MAFAPKFYVICPCLLSSFTEIAPFYFQFAPVSYEQHWIQLKRRMSLKINEKTDWMLWGAETFAPVFYVVSKRLAPFYCVEILIFKRADVMKGPRNLICIANGGNTP